MFDRYEASTSQRETFTCQQCGEGFNYRAMLDRHMWTHKNDNLDHTCSEERARCTMEQLLQCDYCDKVLPCNLIRRHVRQIHFHESFSCVLCERFDMTPEAYAKHVHERHSGREDNRRVCAKCDEIHEVYSERIGIQYFCDYCILVRPSESAVNRTKGKANYPILDCHLCGAFYPRECELMAHMHLHRAPKYICIHCHKIFVNYPLYEEHVKRHAVVKVAKKINYANATRVLKRKMMCPL